MNGKNILEPDHSSSVSGISDRLRVLEKRYKNRAEATEAFGVNRSAFDKWVAMKSIPSLEAVAKIAKAANVSLDWLAFGVGKDMEPEPPKQSARDLPSAVIDRHLMAHITEDLLMFTQRSADPLTDDEMFNHTCDIYDAIIDVEGLATREKIKQTLLRMIKRERQAKLKKADETVRDQDHG